MAQDDQRSRPRTGRRTADGVGGPFAQAYLDALLAGDVRAATTAADEAIAAGLSPAAVHREVIARAMTVVGDRWASGDLTVADEHLATVISTDVLTYLYPRLLTSPPAVRERVLLATAEGEEHALGLRMVADLLDGAGFETRYLGADVPVVDLGDAIARWTPDLLLLSVTMPEAASATLEVVRRAWARGQGPRVVIGGAAAPGLADRVDGVLLLGSEPDPLDAIERALLATGPVIVHGAHWSRHRAPVRARPGPTASLMSTTTTMGEIARQRAREMQRFEWLAYRDPVADTWNRRALDDRLLEQTTRDAPGFMAMVDIDHFKDVNDRFGHARGDAVLRTVGTAIVDATRQADFVARYGGDEFAVLLATSDPFVAASIAERIRATVADCAADPPVSVSIGLAPVAGDPRRAALEADRCLYAAKQDGRDRVVARRQPAAAAAAGT
jgi:diguanylate cyclase (GGDEF)-like protein